MNQRPVKGALPALDLPGIDERHDTKITDEMLAELKTERVERQPAFRCVVGKLRADGLIGIAAHRTAATGIETLVRGHLKLRGAPDGADLAAHGDDAAGVGLDRQIGRRRGIDDHEGRWVVPATGTVGVTVRLALMPCVGSSTLSVVL